MWGTHPEHVLKQETFGVPARQAGGPVEESLNHSGEAEVNSASEDQQSLREKFQNIGEILEM